jgi:arginyl-tRNA synthetase
MLSLSGNTAPYMLYAYVRIKGIQRKAAASLDVETVSSVASFVLQEPDEIALAKHILRFGEILREIEIDLYPNKVTCIHVPYYQVIMFSYVFYF